MAGLKKRMKACSVLSVSIVLLLWLNITARASYSSMEAKDEENERGIPVGVILDLTSELCIMANYSLALAVEDYYSHHQVQDTATKIHLVVRNIPQNDVVAAAVAAFDLIKYKKVHAILGPQNLEQARFIVEVGEKYKVPVIWFPITGPSLLPPPSPSSIYSDQGLNCFQFRAIADIIKALGWQSIVPIYEETEYGSQLIPCLANVLKDMGIRMANVTTIVSDVEVINNTLNKLKDMRTHVFLVHMSMDSGIEFIKSAWEKEMMGEGYAWILTQELSSSLTNPQVSITRQLYYPDQAQPTTNFTDHFSLTTWMQGALGVRPVDTDKTDVRRGIEKDFSDKHSITLTIYGWWAYHTIEALAMALEKPGTNNNGTKLGEEIRDLNFTGKSGLNFSLSKGQLNQSVLEVYNVIGERERIIGSWSPETGLVQNYNKGVETSNEYQLKDPLWPGDTLDKPPKLRIGVPRTNSFPEFVRVYNSNKRRIDGFAISVFLKALDVLPFRLNNYEFVPLPNKRRSDAPMTYDDILCSQMKVEDLDAIIGDITIVANRINCVDFTLPYLDSSVAMVVSVKNATSKTNLLKPFKWSLWLNLGGIFVFATIIIIILEKSKAKKTKKRDIANETNERNKSNESDEFRHNPFLVYKIDVMENFASNPARWMVILTSFLFVLAVQVYTANLTSILTQVNMKEPSFRDENDIKSSNVCVGYQNGSWVRGLLIDQIGLEPSRLKSLGSCEEYNEALSSGTKGGGVDAIFDETPYLTLFLSQYQSRFMMTGPTYKTGGFAFAFPKKSRLVSHFSNSILKVSQDVEPYRMLMAKSSLPTSVEDLEFVDQSDKDMTSLGIADFGGLYPVLLSVMGLFLGLAILSPSVIQWLRKKLRVSSNEL